jgi:hypothetical protein
MPSGGFRPFSGRKKKGQEVPKETPKMIPADIVTAAKSVELTPLEYMLAIMNDETLDPLRRDRMAVAAAPYVHTKRAATEVTKKEVRQAEAETAGTGSEWGDDLSTPGLAN